MRLEAPVLSTELPVTRRCISFFRGAATTSTKRNCSRGRGRGHGRGRVRGRSFVDEKRRGSASDSKARRQVFSTRERDRLQQAYDIAYPGYRYMILGSTYGPESRPLLARLNFSFYYIRPDESRG